MNIVKLQNLLTGVFAWNSYGFTGKNICIWNMESGTDHSEGTTQRIYDAAPGIKVICADLRLNEKHDQVISSYVYDPQLKEEISAEQFIERNNIRIVTSSRTGHRKVHARTIWFTELQKKYNLIYFQAAGNEGSYGVSVGKIPLYNGIYVGTCIMYNNDANDIRMAHYSGVSERANEVDFSTFPGSLIGTSFSAPYLAGITALLLERYGKMSQAEVVNYYKMCCLPIAEKETFRAGYDMWSGYGLPILHDPHKKYITMVIGKTKYMSNGYYFDMGTAPEIVNDLTFVPVAFIAESLGADIAWDGKEQSVVIKKGTKHVKANTT